jgi:hypothetical protein
MKEGVLGHLEISVGKLKWLNKPVNQNLCIKVKFWG